MSQKRMADLFGVERATINYHLSQIYENGELTKEATCRKIQQVQLEGSRDAEQPHMGLTISFLDFAETRAQRHIITKMEDSGVIIFP